MFFLLPIQELFSVWVGCGLRRSQALGFETRTLLFNVVLQVSRVEAKYCFQYSTFNIQTSIFNIQSSIFNIQTSIFILSIYTIMTFLISHCFSMRGVHYLSLPRHNVFLCNEYYLMAEVLQKISNYQQNLLLVTLQQTIICW